MQIDDGTDEPGRKLKSAWVTLTQDEAWALIDALLDWSEIEDGDREPGWHTHVDGPDGTELTIAIEPTDAEDSGHHHHSHH